MLPVSFPSIERVLCIGAHADDIEIGCGGTLLRLLELQPGIHVDWLVATSDEVRAREARESAAAFCEGAAKLNFVAWEFKDGFLPYLGSEVKEAFRDFQSKCSPDLIFTHRLEDRHQDHKFLAEMTWNSFRDHLILEYEIPKYEGDLGQPNWFVTLEEAKAERKVSLLEEHFVSQASKPWFSAQTFESLMRIRGLECKSPSSLAEAFTVRKAVC